MTSKDNKNKDQKIQDHAAQQLAIIFTALLDSEGVVETTPLSPGRPVGDKKT